MNARTPILIRVDLRKCVKSEGSGYHDHPDISIKKRYLAKIDGEFFVGKFTREWYGFSFDGWHDVGCQLDKPRTNGSDWQGLWEIK